MVFGKVLLRLYAEAGTQSRLEDQQRPEFWSRPAHGRFLYYLDTGESKLKSIDNERKRKSALG